MFWVFPTHAHTETDTDRHTHAREHTHTHTHTDRGVPVGGVDLHDDGAHRRGLGDGQPQEVCVADQRREQVAQHVDGDHGGGAQRGNAAVVGKDSGLNTMKTRRRQGFGPEHNENTS